MHARAIAAFVLLLIAACERPVSGGLTEQEANRVVTALERGGIGANKVSEPGQGETPLFRVDVAAGDQSRAIALLTSEDLPRELQSGLGEVFASASLVPTATEERVRFMTGLAGELGRSLESLDGVQSARVHLALPEPKWLTDPAPPKARASVLIRHRGASPPIEGALVQRLVAGAVDGLAEADVAVVFARATDAPASAERAVRIGPISVSEGTAPALKLLLGVLLLSNALLAVALVVFTRRAKRVVG